MIFIIIIFLFFLSSSELSFAVEIASDTLERFEREKKNVATGNVRITGESFTLTADRAIHFEEKNEVEAKGNIYYEDEEIRVWAEEAYIKLDEKTGTLKNALIHVKFRDFWIKAEEIERLSEIKYKAKKATFSTCEPEKDRAQPWCFTAETVDLIVDEILFSTATTFRVKDIPIAFTPFFWGPGGNNRKSGFLPLNLGFSKIKGFQISPAYFLVIDSNKDATFYIDYFSKAGIGKGVELRYLGFDVKGMWYGYQINDKITNKNYQEMRGVHLQKIKGVDLLVDINYVNKKDFYREYADVKSHHPTYLFKDYGKDLQVRYDRFLQSSVELSTSAEGGRFYFLGQGWMDLKTDGMSSPMRAEVGYVVYPFQIGPLNLSFNINMAQYYKEDGLNGQRFELNSQMSNTLGGTIKLTQSLSAHAIFYNLEKTSPYDDISHREMIHYNSKVFMKLYKRTEKYFQIVEPFVEGDFISVNGNPPILRESDLIDNTALIRTGVYSRVNGKNISFEGRIAQLYDFKARGQWNKLYPTLIEAKASFWKISLGFDSYQNITKKRIERLNSWLNFSPDESTSISLSQRYTRHGAVIPLFLWSMTLREQYSLYDSAQGIKTLGMNFFKKLSEKWSFSLNTNYDLKGAGLRDSSLHLRYAEKCWASNITLTRRPIFRNGRETSEFNFIIFFELKGMGAIKPPMDFLRK